MSAEAARPPRRRLYIDTSAYLCVLLAADGAERVSAESDGAELLWSVLLLLEAPRNLTRLARDGTPSPERYAACIDRVEQDAHLFVLRDLTLDLCQSSILPAVLTPRSFDLVHLRTALWFHGAEPIDRFGSMDISQQQAAKELGLPV